MAKIVSKLDLNKVPQLADNHSLVFAKNIKTLKDGTIGADNALDVALSINSKIIGQIVGLDGTVFLFISDKTKVEQTLDVTSIISIGSFVKATIEFIDEIGTTTQEIHGSEDKILQAIENYFSSFDTDYDSYIAEVIIPPFNSNRVKYVLHTWLNRSITIRITYIPEVLDIHVSDVRDRDDSDVKKTVIYNVNKSDYDCKIYEYDEINKIINLLNCGWKYSGGEINGVSTINNTDEEILTICEYFDEDTDVLVPLKHINLAKCSEDDNESIYTQAPNVPKLNLHLFDTYTQTIPNGVYQFFVRFEIYKDNYTNWFPCSKECFAGVPTELETVQGSVRYIDTSLDSSKSFIFNVECLSSEYKSLYKRFQLGFIIANDDAVNARTWKHFDIDTTTIYFNYDEIKEINIDDLLYNTYDIYNTKNIVYFKNKLYISNYIESDFNEDLSLSASGISVDLKIKEIFSKDIDNYYINNTLAILDDNKFIKVGNENINSWINRNRASLLINKLNGRVDDKNCIAYSFCVKFRAYLDDDIAWVYTTSNYTFTDGPLLPTFYIKELDSHHWYHNHRVDISYENEILHDKRLLYETNDEKYYAAVDWHPFLYYNALTQLYCAGWFDNKLTCPTYNIKQPGHTLHAVDDGVPLDRYAKSVNTQIQDYINKTLPKRIVRSVKCKIGDTTYYLLKNITTNIQRSIFDNTGRTSPIDSDNYLDLRGSWNCGLDVPTWDIENYVIDHVIVPNLVDIVNDGTVRVKDIEGRTISINDVEVEYIDFTYNTSFSLEDVSVADTDNPDGSSNYTDERISVTTYANKKTYNYSFEVRFDKNLIQNATLSLPPKQYRTLLPFTDYNFYAHYVKDNGVITNGHFITKTSLNKLVGVDDNNNTIDYNNPNFLIYPEFKNITIPNGYDSVFFSIEKVGNDIITGFNYSYKASENSGNNTGTNRLDCIDLDCLLYRTTDKITILNYKGDIITKEASYNPSYTTVPTSMFGNVGCIQWNGEKVSNDFNKLLFIKIQSQDDKENLTRITPYINVNNYSSYENMYLPAYVCVVTKPKDIVNADKRRFVSGTDAYLLNIDKDNNNNTSFVLEDDEGYLSQVSSNDYAVYSKFNLNYLTILEKPIAKFRNSIIYDASSSTTVKQKIKQMIYMFDSSTISDIYSLPQMYKDYVFKTYSKINKYNKTLFNNTVRASNINADETYKFIYKFDAEDYYNVPTNKGKITNLVAIGQNIYIHCEHNLFKFSGANSLSAEGDIVKLKESDVFETGITPVFDSSYGFAGLADNKESLYTSKYYVFYDKVANIIYLYFGDNNIVAISEFIEKCLVDVKTIRFNADEYNERFFANIRYNNTDKNLCLSFNLRNKQFTSIHDFNFLECFYTRYNTYFLNNYRNKLYNIDLTSTITNYKELYALSILYTKDMNCDYVYNSHSEKESDNNIESCIDIVYNDDYEKIKALNHINWICNAILSYDNGENLFKAEELLELYAGHKLRIYTDQCSTPLIELYKDGKPLMQNDKDLYSAEHYTYPRYNCGIWSYNYFRDIRNIEDIYKYKEALPPYKQEDANNPYGRGLSTSDKSLIYGKYFVVRIIFKDKNFKLENINFDIQNYEKV